MQVHASPKSMAFERFWSDIGCKIMTIQEAIAGRLKSCVSQVKFFQKSKTGYRFFGRAVSQISLLFRNIVYGSTVILKNQIREKKCCTSHQKFPSLVLPRNATMLLYLIIKFPLKLPVHWSLTGDKKQKKILKDQP